MKTILSFVQVLSFPTGRLQFFADTRLADFYTFIVTFINTLSVRIYSVASFDCLFGQRFHSYYAELLSFGYGPVLVALLVLIWFEISYYFCNRKRSNESPAPVVVLEQEKGEAIVTPPPPEKNYGPALRLLLFLFLLLYPYVSTLLVQFFQCQQVNGIYYLVADYSSNCFDSLWKKMLGPELLLVVLYPLLGPLAIFLLLKWKRKVLNVRFMTARYKEQYYYWDV